MTADGRYVLLVTARGWDKATTGAEPGKGSSNSIDMLDRDTGKLSTLVGSFCDGCQRGAIWPRLSPDGSRVAWTEMVQTPYEVQPIGRWTLHVSTLNPDRTAVTSDLVWQPRSSGSVLVEANGWLPGTSDIVFASNDGVTDCSLTSCLQLFRVADTLPDVGATLLTPPVNGSNAYHEFAHFRGDGWVYTSIGRDGLGADLWRMKPDGSSPERLTFFGGVWSNAELAFARVGGFPEPSYAIVGGMAAVPGGFIAGVTHDANATDLQAWRISLVPR
jgi:Tol biopolymer transport system component